MELFNRKALPVSAGISNPLPASEQEQSTQTSSHVRTHQSLIDMLFEDECIETNLKRLLYNAPKTVCTSSLMPIGRAFIRNKHLKAPLAKLTESLKMQEQREIELRTTRQLLAATTKHKLSEHEHLQQLKLRLKNCDLYNELTASNMFRQ